ncbi:MULTISPECIES: hypothetical protein [Mesotoga]|uniref:hypothetical protein n=1 Tax=Mesotoga TaxID=1184396 RepID=UPI0002E4A58E|nr:MULTISPECIES: hypothetical protein [Mesotoga]
MVIAKRPDSVIPTKLLVGIWMLLLYRLTKNKDRSSLWNEEQVFHSVNGEPFNGRPV